MRSLLLVFCLFSVATAAQPAPQWVAVGTGPGDDVAEAVSVGTGGLATAVAGTFEQTIRFDGFSVETADAPGLESDAFVASFNRQTGVPRWVRRMGTDGADDFGTGVAVCPSGLVVATGRFTGTATFDGGNVPDVTLRPRSSYDGFVVAYSAAGDLVWIEEIRGPGANAARRVVCDDQSVVFVVGGFDGTCTWGRDSGAVVVTGATVDGFVARYAPDGTLGWVQTVGGPSYADLTDVAVPVSGASDVLVASGTFLGTSQFGAVSLQSRGGADAVAIRVDRATGEVLAAGQVGGAEDDTGRGIAVNPLRTTGVLLAGSFERDLFLGAAEIRSEGRSDAFFAFLDTETLAAVGGDRVGGLFDDTATDAGGLLGFYGDLGDETFGAVGVLGDNASSTLRDESTGAPVRFDNRGFADGFALSYFSTAPARPTSQN